ncbi:hypothetical protein AVEN_12311-1 [Araneus ventricosus]|uniref:Uncharacterized protein n=1 Tax=Araneus ventricosus TaxID=182803 RepID=A0A4Y2EBZ0_ARAVE|nr:hypothetical protein AVEN_12311-1 [Araneus ventricosus]
MWGRRTLVDTLYDVTVQDAFPMSPFHVDTMPIVLTSFDQKILVHVPCPLTELFSTIRIVLCQTLQRLQLVWVPLASPQIAYETPLTDFHLRRDVGSFSSDTWPSLLHLY